MKTIKLAVTGMSLLADGGAAILTKVGPSNPSANGVHVMNAGQLSRLSTRVLGFDSPIALKHAIAISNGSATLSIDCTEIKAGDTWENKRTGETGIHKGSTKPGHEGEPYTQYSNHEIELGFAASMKMLEITAVAGLNNAATIVAPARKPANNPLGVPANVGETETAEPNV